MRYLLLSDVHANLEALQTVLTDLQAGDVLLSLGDIVGYGPSPNECIALLRSHQVTAVLGNHDVAAIDDFGTAYFNDNAREAIRWTQSLLEPEHRAWLDELGYELRLPEFLLVHGAPVRYFEYCRNIEAATRAFDNTDARLIFVGHTHIAEWYARNPAGEITQMHMQHGGDLELLDEYRYIINVGSVGQPRDLNPAACYVTYEPEEKLVRWFRREYPVDAVVDKIQAMHLPVALGQRLVQGR